MYILYTFKEPTIINLFSSACAVLAYVQHSTLILGEEVTNITY